MTVVAGQDAQTKSAASQAAMIGWSTRRRHMADQRQGGALPVPSMALPASPASREVGERQSE
jgi:hypothetical protein